jgi:fatty acid desaturase
MNERNTITPVRWGVILTMLSLAGVVVLFELGIRTQWSTVMIISEISLLVILLITFILSFMSSGLWNFSHKPLKELDEREMEMTSKSLRAAYALFTVFVLCLLLVFSLLNIAISIVLAVSLILFAHLLPGAVIAFTEKALRF